MSQISRMSIHTHLKIIMVTVWHSASFLFNYVLLGQLDKHQTFDPVMVSVMYSTPYWKQLYIFAETF